MIRSGEESRPWDRLVEVDPETGMSVVPPEPVSADESQPDIEAPFSLASRLACVGAAWADLVCVLAVVNGCLLAAGLRGVSVSPVAAPWAVAAAVSWWMLSSVVSLRVCGATPGMALVGVAFAQPVRGARLGLGVAAGAVTSTLLGLPNLLGPAGSPLAVVTGQKMLSLGSEAVTRGDV